MSFLLTSVYKLAYLASMSISIFGNGLGFYDSHRRLAQEIIPHRLKIDYTVFNAPPFHICNGNIHLL